MWWRPTTGDVGHFGFAAASSRPRRTVDHLNVMIDPFEVDAAVREQPDSCELLLWGREVRGVRVRLDAASLELLGDLLKAAWRRKAPKRVANRVSKPARAGDAGNT